jgi:hypothetical protein
LPRLGPDSHRDEDVWCYRKPCLAEHSSPREAALLGDFALTGYWLGGQSWLDELETRPARHLCSGAPTAPNGRCPRLFD